MVDTTLPGVFLKGTAAARPAANAVAWGTVYSATDTGVITQSDGVSTWTTWATISSGMADPMTTRGDIIYRDAANATSRLGRGSAGTVLGSDGTDVSYVTPKTVATDVIWDAAGDLAVGSGADTAVRLAIGAAGGALSRVNGAVAWNSGTSFPTAATGDRYWRTDLGLECYYDGTRWLSVAEYTVPWTARTLLGFTVSSNVAHAPVDDTHDIYVTKIEVVSFVVTTNTGANYWTVHVDKTPPTGAGTSLGSTTTAADTANTWTSHQIAVNAVVVRASFPALALIVDVTAGAPGAFYGGATVKYRLVVT